MAFDKFATDGVLQYNDIKKFFESVGHVPSQKEIDEAIEIVTKSKRRAEKFQFLLCLISLYLFYIFIILRVLPCGIPLGAFFNAKSFLNINQVIFDTKNSADNKRLTPPIYT